jgi:drug/metabolite transporter (DMT)-like permease
MGALAIAGGIALLGRYHAYPERFSRKVRPSTIRWLGVILTAGGFLLALWDLLAKALH